MGPLMFIVYVNNMGLSLSYHQMTMYADDIVIYGAGKKLDFIKEKLTQDLNMIMLWCCDTTLSINLNKTKAMLFNPQIKEKNSLRDQSIAIVHEYSYLGMKLDEKLNFTMHLKNVLRNISHKNSQFYRI